MSDNERLRKQRQKREAIRVAKAKNPELTTAQLAERFACTTSAVARALNRSEP